MCVIAIKPRGIKMPSKSMLKAMAEANPDGFGFVSESRYFRTLNFETFCKELKSVPKSENCILHFRWATHGSVKLENCHPFRHKGIFFAHNGVLPIPSKNDKTDSEILFRESIIPWIKAYGFDESKTLIDAYRGTSRFAMLVDGELHTFGHFDRLNGIMYSNLRFLPYLPYYRYAS